MRFHPKSETKKTLLVISDLHLGAGPNIDHRRNFLEDFKADKELVEFLHYFSSGDYQDREVELVINGDFLDFLAVPYVRFFDDEFWSEEAAKEKLKMIMEAHGEVFDAVEKFLRIDRKKIIYIIGNHDAEMIFDSLQTYFLGHFSDGVRSRLQIMLNPTGEYVPLRGIVIKHGHEYESAHHFSVKDSIVVDENGRRYFLPPWGSYYVTRVINRFKQDRAYINAVRPIKKFLINGLAYDPIFTLRFMLANFFYFFMVRFIYLFRSGDSAGKMLAKVKNELALFQDFESLAEDYVHEKENLRALIVGHSHDPTYRLYSHGPVFINTGTWTRMVNLDFDKRMRDELLTFAQVDVSDSHRGEASEESYDINLNVWRGNQQLPYKEFS